MRKISSMLMMSLALVGTSSAVEYVHVMPTSVKEADVDFTSRLDNVVQSWVQKYKTENTSGDFKGWDADNALTELRKIAAGMYAFSHTDEFSSADLSALSGLSEGGDIATHQTAFVQKASAFFQQVKQFESVGTDGAGILMYNLDALYWNSSSKKNGGDYDFKLVELISLIYANIDNPNLLTNDMIWEILSHQVNDDISLGGCKLVDGTVYGSVPVTGNNANDYQGFSYKGSSDVKKFYVEWVTVEYKISQPETENHLLMINAWRYLVQNYIAWVASLPASNPRYDSRIAALYDQNSTRYTNSEELCDFILQMLGRVVYNDLFETDSKAYESFSFRAMQMFYSYADQLFPDNANAVKIKIAAQNALDYLSAKFAFESLEGKHQAPMRRNIHYWKRLGLSDNDYMPNILGILSGAYVYDDNNEVASESESVYKPYSYKTMGQAGGFALWSALMNYRIPAPIHDFMLDKHDGYWARFQSRYTKSHYAMDINSLALGTPDDPAKKYPQYFNADGSIFMSGTFAPVQQLFFVTNNFANVAGGFGRMYYPDEGCDDNFTFACVSRDELRSYDALARPYTIIPRGSDVYLSADNSVIEDWETKFPSMRGQLGDYYTSENMDTYKSFSYGYLTNGSDHDYHLDWPQHYPSSWNNYATNEFGIGRAVFKIFDFSKAEDMPMYGQYIIMARESKSYNRGRFREYAHGFWEVVPAYRFASVEDVKNYITNHNPSSNFPNYDDGGTRHYWYTMTTGESIQMNDVVGSSVTDRGILQILDTKGNNVPVTDYSIDPEASDTWTSIPLMDVWQVDKQYQFTGYSFAHADGKGLVKIQNPYINGYLTLDSRDYKNPTRSYTIGVDANTAGSTQKFSTDQTYWYNITQFPTDYRPTAIHIQLQPLDGKVLTGTVEIEGQTYSLSDWNYAITVAYTGQSSIAVKVVAESGRTYQIQWWADMSIVASSSSSSANSSSSVSSSSQASSSSELTSSQMNNFISFDVTAGASAIITLTGFPTSWTPGSIVAQLQPDDGSAMTGSASALSASKNLTDSWSQDITIPYSGESSIAVSVTASTNRRYKLQWWAQ